MKAGERYPRTVLDIESRLNDQWHRHRYAVNLEAARAILKLLAKDDGLLEHCSLCRLPIAQVIWDLALANTRRQLMKHLARDRKQASNTLIQAQQRAPSLHDALRAENLTAVSQYFRAKYHLAGSRVSHLSRAISKYSNPPGKERDNPRRIAAGRREDSAGNWVFERVSRHLTKLLPAERDKLLYRILKAAGLFYAGRVRNRNQAPDNAPETIARKRRRLSQPRS
jgi:hypothetical protein